jgi:hypothetical protein
MWYTFEFYGRTQGSARDRQRVPGLDRTSSQNRSVR